MANLDNSRIEEAYKLKVLRENAAPKRPCLKCGQACSEAEEGCGCPGCNPSVHPKEQSSQQSGEKTEQNKDMAKRSLYRIFKLSAMLHDILAKSDNDIEPWVAAKINEAYDNIEAAFGYEDYNSARQSMDVSELEENNEQDLYKAIENGHESLLDKIRSGLKRESKENLEKILLETIKVLETK
jgi:hypothetical protein